MKLLEMLNMMVIKEDQQVLYIRIFNKKTGSAASENEELAQELHKAVTKKFKRKVYARFKDNIWEADLAEMIS